jgi:hypothetical protein
MSSEMPARRRIVTVIGPVLVSALLIGLVAHAILHKDPAGADAAGPCHSRPDAVSAIRRDPILNEHPAAGELGLAEESLSCDSSPSDSPMRFIANGLISRILTTSMTRSAVLDYYASLAARSGWHADPDPAGLYSATKPAGACPWWFELSAMKSGDYVLRVYYQPSGVPATECDWASARPMLIQLGD